MSVTYIFFAKRGKRKGKIIMHCEQNKYLRLSDVHQGFCSRMNNVEQLHDSRAIVADGCLASGINDQLIHAPRAKGGPAIHLH